jgi:hypothetical protein
VKIVPKLLVAENYQINACKSNSRMKKGVQVLFVTWIVVEEASEKLVQSGGVN